MKTFVQERGYPLLFLLGGAVMVIANHWSIFHAHALFYYAIFLGPPAFWGGFGALLKPDIIYLGGHGPHRRFVLALMALSLLSIGFLIWLYADYYGVR